MAEIAKNAFASRNYPLAAEIYEQCLKENKNSIDLHFGYADSLAKCGNFCAALDIYSFCYKNSRTIPNNTEHLRHVVSALLDNITSGQYKLTATRTADVFLCAACEDVPSTPVTLMCGHTVCRKCYLKEANRNCKRCGQPKQQGLETNVLIKNLIEKWWPHLLKSSQLRDDGNELFQKGDLEAALEKYDEANTLAPNNPLVLGNRCHVLLRLNRAQQALQDADHVVRLRPSWGKGYYRRGMALIALGRHDDALQALCICVALDKNPQSVRQEISMMKKADLISQVFHRLLLPSLRTRSLSSSSQSSANQARRNSTSSGSGHSKNYIRLTAKTSVKRGSCVLQRGSSDCEDNSSGDEHMPQQQSSRGTTIHLESNPRLHGIINRLFQAVEKVKRLDKGGVEEDESLLKSVMSPPEASDFDCVLCCRTLWRPVTTPCGHTYCWTCLDRCLDYSHACPLCMAPLAEYLASNQRSVTEFIDRALQGLLPDEWRARQQLYQQELRAVEAQEDHIVPVFVCTTAFPSVPCPLFVYEPRYRLMIRRAVEAGTRQFGIAASVEQATPGQRKYVNVGTMLEIRDWLCMSNGCSILSTIGCRRFRVIESGETDGYDLAKVEFLKDETLAPEVLQDVTRLHDRVRQRALQWMSTLPQEAQAEVSRTFGSMPEPEENWSILQDGPAWPWWLMGILPLGNKLKVGILGTTKLDKRLRAIDKTLDYLARRRKEAANTELLESGDTTVIMRVASTSSSLSAIPSSSDASIINQSDVISEVMTLEATVSASVAPTEHVSA